MSKAFGEWVRQQRALLDLTQQDLATAIPCHTVTIRKIELGRLRPSKQMAERLAECLQIAPDTRADFLRQARAADEEVNAAPVSGATAPTARPGFIGREQERATLLRLLRHPAIRLLTLTGVGGIGKTRLAQQLVADAPQLLGLDARLVPLATISEASLVTPMILRELKLNPTADQSPAEALAVQQGDRPLLLVLDNVEHVLPAAPAIEELLSGVPTLKVLATSRTALGLSGEHEFAVPPLALPDLKRLPPVYLLAELAAVSLFVARAQSAAPEFALTADNAELVASLCVQLEGLPLALELAAARLGTLSLAAVAQGMADRLNLLHGPLAQLPWRQHSLRAAIGWSVALLPPSAQQLFVALGVFAGGCTPEAVEAIYGASAAVAPAAIAEELELLHKSSLLWEEHPQPDGRRLCMLETIRAYALEQLAATDGSRRLHELHAVYYLGLAEEAEPRLRGPEQQLWLARLDREYGNLHQAFSWLQAQDDAAGALRLAGALGPFWRMHDRVREGTRWLEQALGLADQGAAGPRAKAQLELGVLAWLQCEYGRAQPLFEQSLSLYRAHGDQLGAARSLNSLGNIACDQGLYAAASGHFEAALEIYRGLGQAHGIASVSNNLGVVAYRSGDYAQARAIYEQTLELWRELGDSHRMAVLLLGLGSVEKAEGCLDAALARYVESLTLYWGVADKAGVAHCLEGLAEVRRDLGALGELVRLYGAATALREAIGCPMPAMQRLDYEQRLAEARQALGEQGYQAAWQAGTQTPLEDIVVGVLGPLLRQS